MAPLPHSAASAPNHGAVRLVLELSRTGHIRMVCRASATPRAPAWSAPPCTRGRTHPLSASGLRAPASRSGKRSLDPAIFPEDCQVPHGFAHRCPKTNYFWSEILLKCSGKLQRN
eukprot:TRINITY_DN2225_c0_g1_i3.p1 TRINITY_DN2225_c0_g1~~TRINITY_DN2225_c0_g1_i3.p1  ORF type:complete len:122 (+),score=3.78 TRINITY_DN2225_c0_g1_i3:22-366(+)